MRSLLLQLFVYGSLPAILVQPYWGVLLWYWYAFMLPQHFAWGVDARLALYIAVATLGSALLIPGRVSMPRGRQVWLLLTLWALYGVSTLWAVNRGIAFERFVDVSKMLLMAWLFLSLAVTERRLRQVIYVVAGSIAFLGLHACLRFIVSGGSRIGGYGGNFSDNNDLALGLNMALPFLWYLAQEPKSRVLRLAMAGLFGAVAIAVIATYSRGGAVTLGAVLVVLVWRSRRRVVVAMALASGLVVAVPYLPESYFERLETIRTYEEDASAMSRLVAMETALRIAREHPITGVGLNNMLQVFYQYVPPGTDPNYTPEAVVAHNTYLQVAAEAGVPALAVYLTLIVRSLLVLQQIQRSDGDDRRGRRLALYAKMIQGSLVAAVVGTMFLSRIQLELIYVLFAMVAVLERLGGAEQLPAEEDAGDSEQTHQNQPVVIAR